MNEIHIDESITVSTGFVLNSKAVLINVAITLNFNLLNILFLHIFGSV